MCQKDMNQNPRNDIALHHSTPFYLLKSSQFSHQTTNQHIQDFTMSGVSSRNPNGVPMQRSINVDLVHPHSTYQNMRHLYITVAEPLFVCLAVRREFNIPESESFHRLHCDFVSHGVI